MENYVFSLFKPILLIQTDILVDIIESWIAKSYRLKLRIAFYFLGTFRSSYISRRDTAHLDCFSFFWKIWFFSTCILLIPEFASHELLLEINGWLSLNKPKSVFMLSVIKYEWFPKIAESSSTAELGSGKNINIRPGQLKTRQCGEGGRLQEGNDLEKPRVCVSGSTFHPSLPFSPQV